MSRSHSRSLAGLAVLALSVGLLSVGLVGTPAAAAPDPKIWGVVVDGRGHPLLDVVATAVNEDGDKATALSYEGGDADDSPRVGYFGLFPGANGTYTVTLKKTGYVTERFSVEIARGHRVQSLGDVVLLRTTKATGRLLKSSISVGDRGKVKVAVTPAGEKPTGRVQVKEGRKVVGSEALRARDRGETTITLDKLVKGSHDLKIVYGGSAAHAGSTSGRLTLEVKARRSGRVPNALTYAG